MSEGFLKINGKTHYAWRAVENEGHVLEPDVTARRDRRAVLEFFGKPRKCFSWPKVIVIDKPPFFWRCFRRK